MLRQPRGIGGGIIRQPVIVVGRAAATLDAAWRRSVGVIARMGGVAQRQAHDREKHRDKGREGNGAMFRSSCAHVIRSD